LQHFFHFAPFEGGIDHFFKHCSSGPRANFSTFSLCFTDTAEEQYCRKLVFLCGTSCGFDTSFQIRRRSQRYCLCMSVSSILNCAGCSQTREGIVPSARSEAYILLVQDICHLQVFKRAKIHILSVALPNFILDSVYLGDCS